MCVNMSDFKINESFKDIILLVNHSELTVNAVCVYEEYRVKENEQLEDYKMVGYALGALIILSNIIVVISSGLILKKGQQSKSTYLILGNVSLADTIVGFALIFGLAIDNPTSSNTLCIFQMGLLVCPAMVSIFSVGLIAVDRYIYILHGLYYQRWFTSTKVRIATLCIWMIGIILGFLPATGWINHELSFTRCIYIGLFPGELILLNSLFSIIPIAMVAILYSIILIRALKTVNKLNATIKTVEDNTTSKPKLRISRGTVYYKKSNSSQSLKPPSNNSATSINRSASFSLDYIKDMEAKQKSDIILKSKSIDDLIINRIKNSNNNYDNKNTDLHSSKNDNRSESSVFTVDSHATEATETNGSSGDIRKHRNGFANSPKPGNNKIRKAKEPNKWRAVTVVMLTSGSVIFTWMPFFIGVIFFVFCEEKLTNPKCMYIRSLLGGPLATMAFFNSILNPLIYAWWHKGFQRSVRGYYKKYVRKFFLISR